MFVEHLRLLIKQNIMKMKLFTFKTLLASAVITFSATSIAQTNVFDDVIATSPNHTLLEAALIQEGLDAALSDPTANYTVFAPDDNAMNALAAALNTDINGILALPNLSDILLYHVLGAQVPSSAVTNGLIATPLSTTNTLKLTVNGSNVFVNQATVTTVDLTTDNGVVHVIDAVVLPAQTVADIAIGSPAHTSLVAAVVEAKLLPALTDPFGTFTVFAPTNTAFDNAVASLGIDIATLLGLPNLADILLYHVLGAEVQSAGVTNGLIAAPLNTANTIKFTVNGSMVYANQAPISAVDLTADNGVVHVLDAVILPNQTVADVAIGSAAHTSLVAAVVEAKLLPALTDPFASFTVFAPTNTAFDNAVASLGLADINALLALPNLGDILLYHVLGAEVPAAGVTNGLIASPLNTANTIKFTVDGSMVYANQAPISAVDLTADNGVVHVLDAVVLPNQTVADVAIGSAAHTSLVAAVVEAKLLPALTDPFASFTVFAPTNTAFDNTVSALGLGDINALLALPNLADILLYHVLGAEVPSGSVTNGLIAAPLNTANTIKFTVDGAMVYANQSPISAVDLTADNGVVHVLDAVILPNQTVADIAIGSAVHTSLVAAVVEAKLLPALTDPFASYTVFAPVDAAFDALAAALGTDLNGVLANPELADILLYHVIGAEVFSTDLTNGNVTTLNGQDVTVDLMSGVMINDATVTIADLTSDNGVVHVLDQVLVPSLTSVVENKNQNVTVFPNPTVNQIKLNGVNGSYTVTDLFGKTVLDGVSNGQFIDVNNLTEGTYIITVLDSENVYQTQFVKL